MGEENARVGTEEIIRKRDLTKG